MLTDRWRSRPVLTDRCRCSVRHCGSWRDVLNDGYPRLAPGQCTTTGAGAAYNGGAGAMYSSTGAGATQDTSGAGAMFSTTDAGVTYTHWRGLDILTDKCRRSVTWKAQAQCTHPRAQDQRKTLRGWRGEAQVRCTHRQVLVLAQARCTQRQVHVQRPVTAQAQRTSPRAQE